MCVTIGQPILLVRLLITKMLQKASTLQIQIQGPGHWLVLYIAIATVLAPTSQTLNLITI